MSLEDAFRPVSFQSRILPGGKTPVVNATAVDADGRNTASTPAAPISPNVGPGVAPHAPTTPVTADGSPAAAPHATNTFVPTPAPAASTPSATTYTAPDYTPSPVPSAPPPPVARFAPTPVAKETHMATTTPFATVDVNTLRAVRAVLVDWLNVVQRIAAGAPNAVTTNAASGEGADGWTSDNRMKIATATAAGALPVIVAQPAVGQSGGIVQQYAVLDENRYTQYRAAQAFVSKLTSSVSGAAITKRASQAIPIVQSYIAAVDDALAAIGSLVSVGKEPVPSTPFYKKWWFWAILAVGAGGGYYAYRKMNGGHKQLRGHFPTDVDDAD